MKRPLLSLLSIPLLVLAAFSGQELRADAQDPRYVGTWVIDNERLLDLNEAAIQETLPDGAPEEIAQQMRLMLQKLELELTLGKDGSAVGKSRAPDPRSSGGSVSSTSRGTWKVDGDRISITMQGEDEPEADTQTARLDGEHLIIELDRGPMRLQMPMVRKAPSFVGTWRLDNRRFFELNDDTFARMLPPDLPDEAAAAARRQMAEVFAQMEFEIVLSEDGKGSGRFKMPAFAPGLAQTTEEATGTWEADGRKVTMSLQGEEDPAPESETGTLEDGYLVFVLDQGGPQLKLPLKRVLPSFAGNWALDPKKMVEMNLATMLPPDAPKEVREQMRPMLEEAFGTMQMDLTLGEDGKANGVTVVDGGDEKGVSGTWTLDGDTVSVTMKSESDEAAKTATGKIEGEFLVLRIEQGGRSVALPLKRR